MSNSHARILFTPHGGGPLPLLAQKGHEELVSFWKTLPQLVGKPEGIIVVSAHWEEECISVTQSDFHELIYDYFDFPDEAYLISYPASGNRILSGLLSASLNASGIPARLSDRGLDHGVFVPLKVIFPGADIPVVQISLHNSLDPGLHTKTGQILGSFIRERNLLLLGSGFTFHNMQGFFSPTDETRKLNRAFESHLRDILMSSMKRESRIQSVKEWRKFPGARYCHPREEHLLPLHVCLGAAEGKKPDFDFSLNIMGIQSSAYLWNLDS